eukprot:GHVQ01039209.1.p1 GENE.GHVQ01039209.1~~GHVQ01039209.1.p1  ORF type:complete len:205 (+),score=23.48 GHVQ01039209.1:22-615(+)
MADSLMYVATPQQRFLRSQPSVIAEAQRVKNKENLQVEQLAVKLPTPVESQRARKKWKIGWLLVILVQSAFCLSPFVTPVVALELVESNRGEIQLIIGAALVSSCIGLFSFVALICLRDNASTIVETALGTLTGSTFGITITSLLVLIIFLRKPRLRVKLFGKTIEDTDSADTDSADTDPGERRRSRRRQENGSTAL